MFGSREENFVRGMFACPFRPVDLAKLVNKNDQAPNTDIGQTTLSRISTHAFRS